METVVTPIEKLLDKLPMLGAEPHFRCPLLQGWPVKIMLAVVVIELLLSLGTWRRFGWMLIIQLILSVVGLYLNRNCKTNTVWILVALSALAYPVITHLPASWV